MIANVYNDSILAMIANTFFLLIKAAVIDIQA